jgi:hypothetical protein
MNSSISFNTVKSPESRRPASPHRSVSSRARPIATCGSWQIAMLASRTYRRRALEPMSFFPTHADVFEAGALPATRPIRQVGQGGGQRGGSCFHRARGTRTILVSLPRRNVGADQQRAAPARIGRYAAGRSLAPNPRSSGLAFRCDAGRSCTSTASNRRTAIGPERPAKQPGIGHPRIGRVFHRSRRADPRDDVRMRSAIAGTPIHFRSNDDR